MNEEEKEIRKQLSEYIKKNKLKKEIELYEEFCNNFIIKTDNDNDYTSTLDLKLKFKEFIQEKGYNDRKNGTALKKYIQIYPLKDHIDKKYDIKSKRRKMNGRINITCYNKIIMV
jgi:hypothetical protein